MVNRFTLYAKDTLGTKTVIQLDLNASQERLKNRSKASQDVNFWKRLKFVFENKSVAAATR